MHVCFGSNELVVNKGASAAIVKGSPDQVAEYIEYPGVDHYVLNDGIWLDTIGANQVKFLDKVFS